MHAWNYIEGKRQITVEDNKLDLDLIKDEESVNVLSTMIIGHDSSLLWEM